MSTFGVIGDALAMFLAAFNGPGEKLKREVCARLPFGHMLQVGRWASAGKQKETLPKTMPRLKRGESR